MARSRRRLRSQDFPFFTGQISNQDIVHKKGATLDYNGQRWVRGAWRPRWGLSQLNVDSTAGQAIEGVLAFRATNGRTYIVTQQENGEVNALEEPALIWDD